MSEGHGVSEPHAVSESHAGRRAAVLGSPIAHSLSPVLHRAAYADLGLAWTYEAVECDAARLPRLLADADDACVGLSLTMPLKRAVLPLCDELSPLAAAVGAVNTVTFEGTGRRRAAATTPTSRGWSRRSAKPGWPPRRRTERPRGPTA